MNNINFNNNQRYNLNNYITELRNKISIIKNEMDEIFIYDEIIKLQTEILNKFVTSYSNNT